MLAPGLRQFAQRITAGLIEMIPMSPKAALVSAILLALHAPAAAQQPEFDFEQGAVLCAWNIYIHVDYIGSRCRPAEDRDFKEFLSESIAKIGGFIVDNAPATADQVEAGKKRLIDQMSGSLDYGANPYAGLKGDLCTHLAHKDALLLYDRLKGADLSKLRNEVTKLLAVPRKPVMNPCL